MADLVREYRRAVSDPEIASLRRTLAAMTLEIEQIKAGAVVVVPVDVKHAEAMHLVATAYLKQHRKEQQGGGHGD
jgi:hypothetical protein